METKLFLCIIRIFIKHTLLGHEELKCKKKPSLVQRIDSALLIHKRVSEKTKQKQEAKKNRTSENKAGYTRSRSYFLNANGRTHGRMDGRTDPHIEVRERI